MAKSFKADKKVSIGEKQSLENEHSHPSKKDTIEHLLFTDCSRAD